MISIFQDSRWLEVLTKDAIATTATHPTKKECPFCKPKQCCGAGHKHYVLNTENLEGVCVRHSDDCTPVCVPMGYDGADKRRICTKSCNRFLKALKNPNAKTESEMFDIVVCQ